MKLLAKVPLAVARQYQEILEDEGIEATFDDFLAGPLFFPAQVLGIVVEVFVKDDDHHRAVEIVEKFEAKAATDFKKDISKANRAMLLLVFALLIVIVFCLWMFIRRGL
jgi:hypothetical protein